MLVARNGPVCKVFQMISVLYDFWRHNVGISRCSHTHGKNRNRIALHVMLNRRRICLRGFQQLLSLGLYESRNHPQ